MDLLDGIIGLLPLTAQKFFAWGNLTKRNLNSQGLPLNKIEIVGAPRFDDYTKKGVKKEMIVNEVRSDFRILVIEFQI